MAHMPLDKQACLGLARTIQIRRIHGIFGREINKYTFVYGVYIRFWPTLGMTQMIPGHQTWLWLTSFPLEAHLWRHNEESEQLVGSI